MDYEQQVRRASGGDVKAFVDLTRQFQHMAFGAALALVNDFHQAEDVVQEAFVAAWSALPSLADPAAFPGWLRGIVRHQAFRVLRKRTLRTVPLAEADRRRCSRRRSAGSSSPGESSAMARRRLPGCPASCGSRPRCSSSRSARTRTSRSFSACQWRRSTTACMPPVQD